jgi:hypothetical protein
MPSAPDFRRAFGLEPGARVGAPVPAARGKGKKRQRGADADADAAFTLTAAHVGHEVLSQNERYAFPTELHFKAEGAAQTTTRQRTRRGVPASADALARALREALGDTHIVRSAYGSPYECRYDLKTLKVASSPPPQDDAAASGPYDATLRATCRGLAVRRRDLPTAAQETQAARDAAADAPPPDRDAAKAERARVRREAAARGLRVIVSRFGSSACAVCGAGIAHGEQIARPVKADEQGKRGGWMHAGCALQCGGKRKRAG